MPASRKTVRVRVKAVLQILIENEFADTFYVGNQGNYDKIVLFTLRELKKQFPHITYSVVLAYHPSQRDIGFAHSDETVLPEEIAVCHPRFAIDKQNRYMLSLSDYVIAYTIRPGGAMKFCELAKKNGKYVIDLGELEPLLDALEGRLSL